MELQRRGRNLESLVEKGRKSGKINMALYQEYDVKRGLRDSNGKGVLTGLTEISDVVGHKTNASGSTRPSEGRLYYQGYNMVDLVNGIRNRRFGFEEISYLLMFGSLPTKEELDEFVDILTDFRELPGDFTRDYIMRSPSKNIMNSLQKCVLSLYSYDPEPERVDVQNLVRQSLSLVAKMPLLAVYSYHAYRHYLKGENLFIRNSDPNLSLAENLLQMLHPDGKYTELEAKVLDVALILHAEHGGGNNSTFTTHVVSSTGTDTYSATAASLGSLKGPRHGGANLKVQEMFKDIKSHVSNWDDENEIRRYLYKMLDKKAFDRSGLIYGIGHAVYTKSDPRAVILKEFARALSVEKGMEEEFHLYELVEEIGKECTIQKRNLLKPLCANVDFYSGFVYTMMDFPKELFTPLFAIARISGWSAHRIEEMVNTGKIIRPAYKYIGHHRKYKELETR
ncbi:MAG: citrate/2-methylcitrate synthase [Eubacterium sp.]|nr:citrate/2-methylcitrate synthase [Eubacterium sp.]